MFKKLFKAVSENLFPNNFTCDLCGEETFGYNICGNCLKKFEFNDGNTCPLCGRKTVYPHICLECKRQVPLYNKAVSPLIYADNVKLLIKKFKSGGGYLKEYFAGLINENLKNLPPFDGIIYVPMTPYSSRKRGYNQTGLLAKSVGERTGIPVLHGTVEKIKETLPQKDLTYKERESNIKGSFKMVKKDKIAGRRILVIDDILTTGATANEMTKLLFKAKASKVYLATIASVPLEITGAKN